MRLNVPTALFSLLAMTPIAMFAFSTGPPIKRTGAPIDGGANCSVCHQTFGAANSDPRGSVAINAASYTAGVTQTISVKVMHPDALRWGFQITARLVSDPSVQAGTFAVNGVVRVRCDAVPAHDAPCNGALEFPEHLSAPITDAGAGFTFTVEWTPPATNQGDVVFYAAGNAANNDKNLTGDRVYTTRRVISPACALATKPSIKAAVNAASFTNSMASNALISIFGANFTIAGAKRIAGDDDLVSNNKAFPKQLACIAVEVDGKRAPISYIQGDQINIQVPTTANLGTVSVRVIANPDTPGALMSDASTIPLIAASPGFFTFDGKSVAAQFAGTPDLVADPSVVQSARAAKPGEIITLYGTGFGATNPAVQAGDLATVVSPVTGASTLTIGGTTVAAADLLYVGLTPGSISGLYQVNVRLPLTLADGNLPVVLQAGGVKSQDTATIPVKK